MSSESVIENEIDSIKCERVFVIGDIHGCVYEVSNLIKHLEEVENLSNNDLLVFLGDYVDRGPNSKGVIDLMLEVQKKFPETRFLKGNHEDMMLDFLGLGGRLGDGFLYNGGVETIQSYGISVFATPEEMMTAIPNEHLEFLKNLESMVIIDDFVCVHAGLNPFRDIESQNDGDLFWIREEFLDNVHPFKKTVVFGHTPHQDIFMHLPYKIGIDTGLVFGNKLSCLELSTGCIFQIPKGSDQVTKINIEVPAE